MQDILIIVASNDDIITHFRMDQNYSEVASMVTAVILRTRPGLSAKAYALCDAEAFQLSIDTGKVLGDNVAIDSDYRVILKSAVIAETIIPPSGMVEGDLLPTDEVVCYA